jgi:hypothetical protein
MGCNNSKPAPSAAINKKRGAQKRSVPLTDEEKQRLEEKKNLEILYQEKAHLRTLAVPMIETNVNVDPMNSDLLRIQEEELSKLNSTASRIQKQMRRKEAKLKAEAQQKWMVFSNIDVFDEAEIVQLTIFMKTLIKK